MTAAAPVLTVSGITLLALLGMPVFCVLGLIALLAFRAAGIDTTAVIVSALQAPRPIALDAFQSAPLH